MKKPLRFLALVAMLCIPWVTQAQNIVEIGDGTATSNQVPIGTYYNYSITEMLYTDGEIGTAGSIQSISFYYMGVAEKDLPITVYMDNVDNADLSTGIDLASATEVFNGTLSVTTTAGWVTINLDTPFEYDGSSNLLIGIIKDYLYYFSGQSWQGTSTSGTTMARYSQSDGTAYNTSTVPGNTSSTRPNIQIEIIPGAGPTCPKPTGLTLEDVTSNSVEVSWTAGGSEPAWDVYVTTSNVPPTAETVPTLGNTSANPFPWYSLSPATHYYLYVRARCSDEDRSNWTAALQFTTLCASITDLPWNQNFEGFDANTVPDCWDNSASGTSTIGSNPERVWGVYSNGGNKMLRMYNYYVSSGTALINTPPIELPSAGVYQLSFDYSNRANCGAMTVKISTDGGTSFTDLESYSNTSGTNDYNNPGEFTTATIPLSTYAGETVILQFFSTANYSSGAIFLDNVKVEEAPSCLKPTGLQMTDVAADAVRITWTPNGTEETWDIYYTTSNEAPTAETTPTVTNTNNQSPWLYNMTPLTTYNVYVRAHCSAEERSEWSAALQVTTAAGIPLNETFSTNSLPVGWMKSNTLLDDDVMSGTTQITQNNSGGWNFGTSNGAFDSHARVNLYGTSCKYWLVAPTLMMEDNVQLTFDLALTAYDGTLSAPATTGTDDKFVVLISDGSRWEVLRQWDNAGSADVLNDIAYSATGQNVAIDLSAYAGQNVTVAFYAESTIGNADNNLHIDNVSINYIPSCAVPTALHKVDGTAENPNPTAHAVQVAWTANNGETEWVLAYKKSTEENFTEVAVTENPYTLDGLDGSTTYNIKVKADCGAGAYSDYTNPINVTTLVSCPAPTSLTKTPFVSTALLGWTSDASQFVVAYKANGEDDFTEISDITENPYTLTGLAATTTYTFKVKAVCGGIDGESQWSSTSSFTTVDACAAVSGLAVSGVTETGATLTWNAGEATDWVLQYGTDNTFTDFEEETPTTATWTFTGLTPNTVYYARVKVAGCDDENEHWSTVSFEPTNKVVVGSGNAISSNLPSTTGYDYSYTQQIYTATELGAAGAILSVDFYMTSTTAYTRSLDVYIVSTTKETFDNTSDWVAVTASDLVFSGDVDFAANSWTTIVLDNPFIYDGTNNVVVVVDDNTGAWSSRSFKTFATTGNQSHYAYQDDNNIDPAAPSASYNYTGAIKNQARFLIGEPPTCNKPTGLTVSYTDGTTATVSWTSDAAAWNIDVNGDVTAITENPYTLTGLSLGTTYNVKLQADCDANGTSEWTTPVNFTTDFCLAADMCEITFTLTDEYGDGWNGAYIEVIDVATSNTIAMIEADNHGTYQEETDIKTLSVCDGSELQFVWHSGSYDEEASYMVTDVNGDEIFSGADAMLNDEYYTVDCGGGSSSVVSIDKSITANQWYAISSPVHEDGKNYEVVLNITNLISGNYDLMRWEETQAVWESQKSGFSTLDMGRGYIYRNAANQELTFNDYSYSGSIGVDITHTCIDNALEGFNLIGNPYTKAYTPDHDYYKLQTNGTWTAYTAGNGSVAVAEGFLIFEDGTDIYMFQEPAKGVKSVEATTLAFTVSNDEYSDVAYARFGAGEGMPKFGHLNPAAPMLSIPQGETSYAIANLDESTESFPLSFSGTGEYTLTVDNTAAFGYLHLIDHATGADIDLLRASYTFKSTGSNADRFLVKLSPDNNENTFVRISGDRIIVDGTGELEVYDVMGRQLFNTEIRNSNFEIQNSIFPSAGVYVLRLNGNSQKIVIK